MIPSIYTSIYIRNNWPLLFASIHKPLRTIIMGSYMLTQQQVGQQKVTKVVGRHSHLKAVFRHLSLLWTGNAGVVDLWIKKVMNYLRENKFVDSNI